MCSDSEAYGLKKHGLTRSGCILMSQAGPELMGYRDWSEGGKGLGSGGFKGVRGVQPPF